MHASPIAPLGAGENGGLNVYIRAVCEELSRRGVPSEVFTRRSSSEGAERLQLAERSWVTRLAVGPAQELEKQRLFDLLPAFSEAIVAEQRRSLRLGEARVIVFAGRLERLKGAEIVIRALAQLPADGGRREPVLLMLGDDSQNGAAESQASGGERLRLEALSRSLGVGPQVRFLGAVDQPTLARYLSLADVCVVPSYSESFGLVALEAAACGTPVVAARA